MLKLKFKDQRRPPIWLVETVTKIGTDPRNHVVIHGNGVEAVHAEITKEGDALYLSDSGTALGTQVNGTSVRQKFQLRPGDEISIADTEMEILDPQAGSEDPTAKVPPSSGWSIMGLSGELKGKSIAINGSMVFGRSSGCDIVVNDAHMSRRHAELNLSNGLLRIVDLQSSNGTSVNNQKVGERILRPGDKIQFDHIRFLVVGPLNAEVPEDDEDDDDEATVFRAAPIPRAPEQRKPVSVPPPLTPTNESHSIGEPRRATSWLPLAISAFVLVVAFIAGIGLFMVD